MRASVEHKKIVMCNISYIISTSAKRTIIKVLKKLTFNKLEKQLVQKTYTVDNTSFDCWVIKIRHMFWFKARDIAVFLGYKDTKQAVRSISTEARKKWSELTLDMSHKTKTPPYWQPHTVLISEIGLKTLITKTTLVNVNRIKHLSDALGLNLNVIPLTKEQTTSSAIMDAFYDYECIPQYTVLSYRIDLYLPKVILAIECDEFNHRRYNLEAERKHEQEIREHLGCTFFRYNPDDKNFNIFRMISDLRNEIASKQKFQVKDFLFCNKEMENQLVQKTFTIDDICFDCCAIKIGNKFWFKAHDIAVFLEYQNPE